MNTPTRTRPGHWADVPAGQDERDVKPRAPRAAIGVVFAAVIFLVVLVVVLVRYFLKG